ncbi:MAG: DNA cytosine methyltransferase [Eubacterium sp.]|nr:DNA cytosine methyltransferase [Eubacterium sp.]
MDVKKINTIDLFAGCGGLMDGFEQSGHYETVAAVEWEKAPCSNLAVRLKEKWKYTDAESRVLRFDIQRTEELCSGWDDDEYGTSGGLDPLIKAAGGIDVIIGGPPCQAYSIAGRVRDENGMRDDYRNYLFESYLKVVSRYRPCAFVFENVPGILSAKPGDRPIIEIIKESFDQAGYQVLPDLKKAVIDFTEYGVPQNRKRMIILGLHKSTFGEEQCLKMVEDFYADILPKYKVKKKKTVADAIKDLPGLYPLKNEMQERRYQGRKLSHSLPQPFVPNHVARWQSRRDMGIFELLTKDIESGRNEYVSAQALKDLYTQKTGRKSNVHKYHVLRWNEPSNLIPAHLYKDGLRHIHPDPAQLRTITVREAARLQTFSDDYIFYGSNVDTYKMIGNAVPPQFSKQLAEAVYDLFLRGASIKEQL